MFIRKFSSLPRILRFPLGAILIIFLFVGLLVTLMFVVQFVAGVFGYSGSVVQDVGKSALIVGGAIGVAFVALYGVQSQNLSAEERHRVDSALELKKDIFLEVVVAAAAQYQYLLSFANPLVTEEARQEIIKEMPVAFFRLQLVATEETIFAMLDSNEAWVKCMFAMRQLVAARAGAQQDSLQLLCDVQRATTPWMKKLWAFNAQTRVEIGCGFVDGALYAERSLKKFDHIAEFFESLRDNAG